MSEAVDDAMPEPGHSLEDEEAIDDMWHEDIDIKEPTDDCWALWFFIRKWIFDNKDDKPNNK